MNRRTEQLFELAIRLGIYTGVVIGCLLTWIASELTVPRAFEVSGSLMFLVTLFALWDIRGLWK